jgi:hypothetical protein
MKNKLVSKIGNHIVLDLIETWPKEVKQIIENNEEIIREYLELECEIDRQAQEDVLLRVFRPENKYKVDWSNIVDEIEGKLKTNSFVGFHCTKLIDSEITHISTYGLKPLSNEILSSRLEKLYSNGMLSKMVFEQLKSNNLSTEYNRKDRVFFFHGVNTLKSESGLYRLFRLWGGEALYANHERNHEIYTELFYIGKPCIVLGSLTYEDINPYPLLATRFVNVFLNKDNLKYNAYDFDNCVKNEVKVLNIITEDEELFEQLTNYSKWKLDR